jgi:hypothetical protein
MLCASKMTFSEIMSATKEVKEQHKLPKLYSPLHSTLEFVITRRNKDAMP